MLNKPGGGDFTEWKRLDFGQATMRRILTEPQLPLYLPTHAEAAAFFAAQLAGVPTTTNELAYYQSCRRY